MKNNEVLIFLKGREDNLFKGYFTSVIFTESLPELFCSILKFGRSLRSGENKGLTEISDKLALCQFVCVGFHYDCGACSLLMENMDTLKYIIQEKNRRD